MLKGAPPPPWLTFRRSLACAMLAIGDGELGRDGTNRAVRDGGDDATRTGASVGGGGNDGDGTRRVEMSYHSVAWRCAGVKRRSGKAAAGSGGARMGEE